VLNLFRDGIKPAWEDPENKKGYDMRGEIDVSPDKKEAAEKIYKDLWQNFVFGLIGEDCKYSQHIAGLRWKFQPNRTAVRIEIWIKHPPPTNLPTKPLDRNSVGAPAEDQTDEKWKICAAIKTWVEDKIKTVRPNVPQITYTTH